MVRKYILCGADVNQVDVFGYTPLNYACRADGPGLSCEVIEVLLQNGANMEIAADDWGFDSDRKVIFRR
jgi:ankyrin repeat protein